MAFPPASSVVQDPFAPYEVVAEIGSRPHPLYVVRHAAPGGKQKLLVAQRFAGAGGDAASFVNVARRISTLASPNVARVRDVSLRGDDCVIIWDFVDGEKLEKIWLSGAMPLDVALRVILDVLAGLSAIHGLRDAKQLPMHICHGEISAATIVLGVDGGARVMHVTERQLPAAPVAAASLGYLAPEVHARLAHDARADIFSVGVLLWEALSGKRLFVGTDPDAIAEQVRAGNIAPALVSEKTPWAKGLAEVAAKALAISPADRWPTAAMMANEVRKLAGLKLASAMAAATFAKSAVGERANARRARFESGTRSPAPPNRSGTAARTPVVPPPIPPAVEVASIDPDRDVETVADSLPPSALVLSPPEPIVPRRLIVLSSPSPLPAAPTPSPSPPPLPARARLASGSDALVVVPEENETPHFDASSDIPISIAPPPTDPHDVSPTSIEQRDEDGRHPHTSPRFRGAVLGGVAALGTIVFVLAAWRFVHQSVDARRSGEHASSAAIGISRPIQAAPPSIPATAASPTAGPVAAPAIAPTPAPSAPSRVAHASAIATPPSPTPKPATPKPVLVGVANTKPSAIPSVPKRSPPSNYHPTSL